MDDGLVVMVANTSMPQAGWFPMRLYDMEPDQQSDILEAVIRDRVEQLGKQGVEDGKDFDASSWDVEVATRGSDVGTIFASDFDENEWEYQVRFPKPDEVPDSRKVHDTRLSQRAAENTSVGSWMRPIDRGKIEE